MDSGISETCVQADCASAAELKFVELLVNFVQGTAGSMFSCQRRNILHEPDELLMTKCNHCHTWKHLASNAS